MVDSIVKTERVFIFGICCSLLVFCARKILVHFQIIKGDVLLICLALFTLIWFIFSLVRIYRLNKRYSENKNTGSKDIYCLMGYIMAVVLAIVLHILPE